MDVEGAKTLAARISGFPGYRARPVPAPAGGFAVLVEHPVTGGRATVETPEAWEHLHDAMRREVQSMLRDEQRPDATATVPTVGKPAPASVPVAAPVAAGGRRFDFAEWRRLTEAAIAQAEADEAALQRQVASLEDQIRACREEIKTLRRALGVTATPTPKGAASAPQGPPAASLTGRVLAWAEQHDGVLAVRECAAESGLTASQVTGVATTQAKRGVLLRIGPGRFRRTIVAGAAG